MCQIIPFTLPCCRRIYVEISKLPSCPNSWPNRKCPAELCIQVRGYEAENRDAGTCWRCKASKSGATGHDREALRPKIDKASLALGLEEIGVSDRRRKTERDGKCWFCGAKGGCKTCGARDVEIDEGPRVKVENTGFKKRPGEVRLDSGKGKGKDLVNKRLKIERREQKLPAAAYVYPDPNVASKWPEPYPQAYSMDDRNDNQGAQGYSQEPQLHQQQFLNFDQEVGAEDFSYDSLPQMVGTTQFEAGDAEQSCSANWQAVNTKQRDTPGLSNTNSGLQRLNRFLNDGAQVGFKLQQYHVNEDLSRYGSSTDRGLQQSIEAKSSNTNTGQRQSSQFSSVGGHVDFKPQHHPVNENLSRPSQGTSRPSSTNTGKQLARQFNSHGPQVDFNLPQNNLYDYVSFSNSDNIDQYRQVSNDESRDDSKSQQYYANEDTLYLDPGIEPALLQNARQQSTATGHPASNDFQDDLSQFMNGGLQNGFNPQQHSNEYASYPEQNTQPGRQDVPPLFDFATMDDATLAREIDNYGCYKPTEQLNTDFQLAVSDKGPLSDEKQTQRPS